MKRGDVREGKRRGAKWREGKRGELHTGTSFYPTLSPPRNDTARNAGQYVEFLDSSSVPRQIITYQCIVLVMVSCASTQATLVPQYVVVILGVFCSEWRGSVDDADTLQ